MFVLVLLCRTIHIYLKIYYVPLQTTAVSTFDDKATKYPLWSDFLPQRHHENALKFKHNPKVIPFTLPLPLLQNLKA